MDLLDLPYEQLLPIYKLCYIPDLINLACTSRSLYASVAEHLWHTIEIPWGIVPHESFKARKLENLKHTRVLRFRRCNSKIKRWDLFNMNYVYLLQHCNGEKVAILEVDGILGSEGIVMTCTSLYNLKDISLKNCENISNAGWLCLSNLQKLKRLVISNYTINIEVIKHIIKIKNLQELKLGRQCNISADTLDPLHGLTKLRKLTICDASAQECPYIETNLNLSELRIEYGKVNNSTMTAISSLQHLKKLAIVDCIGINEDGLSSLGQLELLETLHLVGNNFTDAGISHLTKLNSLKVLDISSSNLSEVGLSYIYMLTTLSHLYLYNCQGITNNALAHISNLENLKLLDISSCDCITYTGIYHISKLPILRELCLDDCSKITDLALLYISNLTFLTHLDLHCCCYVTDTGLGHLSKLTYLQMINLSMAPHTEDINFKKLTGRDDINLELEDFILKGLNVTMGPDVTDTGLSFLQNLPLLQNFNIERCAKVTDHGLFYIGNMNSLFELNISSCIEVSDAGLIHISKLKCLCKLNVSCTAVTDMGLSYLSKGLELLREIDISYCWKVTNLGLSYLCTLLSFLKTVIITDCSNINIDMLPDYPCINFDDNGDE